MSTNEDFARSDGRGMWCELQIVKGEESCPAIFTRDQTAEWIDHHLKHVGYDPPPKLVCWVCDQVFVATNEDAEEDRMANFKQRMQHIRDRHFEFDTIVTKKVQRPDFNYLWKAHNEGAFPGWDDKEAEIKFTSFSKRGIPNRHVQLLGNEKHNLKTASGSANPYGHNQAKEDRQRKKAERDAAKQGQGVSGGPGPSASTG